MATSKTHSEDQICIKHICARAGMWGLLFLAFLVVCASLPLIALGM